MTIAITLNPNYTTAYHDLGAMKANTGDFAGAIRDYNRAIAIDPKFDVAYQIRAIAVASLQDFNLALMDFSKAITLAPEIPASYYYRGYLTLVFMQGNPAMALVDLDKAISLGFTS